MTQISGFYYLKPGKLKMIFVPADGSSNIEKEVYQFIKPGVAPGCNE